MKLFQLIQKNFALLGISTNRSHLNGNSIMVFTFIGLAIISSAVFLLFKANSFVEYINTSYATNLLIACYIVFASLLFNKKKLFKLIDDIEISIEESKLQIERIGSINDLKI